MIYFSLGSGKIFEPMTCKLRTTHGERGAISKEVCRQKGLKQEIQHLKKLRESTCLKLSGFGKEDEERTEGRWRRGDAGLLGHELEKTGAY